MDVDVLFLAGRLLAALMYLLMGVNHFVTCRS